MSVNFTGGNGNQHYVGTLGTMPALGEFTVLYCGAFELSSIAQYMVSSGTLENGDNIQLWMDVSVTPKNQVTLVVGNGGGNRVQTTTVFPTFGSYLVYGTRDAAGVCYSGWINLVTGEHQRSAAKTRAGSQNLSSKLIAYGGRSDSGVDRGVAGAGTFGGILSKCLTVEELEAIARGTRTVSEWEKYVWEFFVTPSATPTITGLKGTTLTRQNTFGADQADLLAFSPQVNDKPRFQGTRFTNRTLYSRDKAKTKWLQSGDKVDLHDPWKAPPCPSMRNVYFGSLLDVFESVASDYIALWDTLGLPKVSLGKDASGTYDIWMYEYAPPNYKQTVILSAALHGSEVYGSAVLFEFMRNVMFRHYNS